MGWDDPSTGPSGPDADQPARLDPDALRLADALDELAAFLAEQGERRWSEWVSNDARDVRQGDGRGVTHFLSALGGMGSLSDLRIGPAGRSVDPDDEPPDERLARLRQRAWERAHELRRDAG